jgi:hypothetical protein
MDNSDVLVIDTRPGRRAAAASRKRPLEKGKAKGEDKGKGKGKGKGGGKSRGFWGSHNAAAA